MTKVIVVGGGAAGLMAGLTAARNGAGRESVSGQRQGAGCGEHVG